MVALTAVMFLTRIPVPSTIDHSPELLARSTRWFPVVGVIVGGAGAAAGAGAAWLWHPVVGALVAVLVTVRLTGAFHEDALADACDGFGGGWTVPQVLTIMKDSRIGSYGAIGLLLVTALRVATLALIASRSLAAFALACIVGHVLGRWSSLPLIRALPYVREDGTGKPFAASVTTQRLVAGTVAAVGAVVLLSGDGVVAASVLAVAVGVTAWAARYFTRRIGGITGDCLGAANQLVEMATYLALATPFLLARIAQPWWTR